jgi:hypothetical protein
MKISTYPWGVFSKRPRVTAFGLLTLCAALLATAALFRRVESRQARPDLAADALPQLNLLGRHRNEAAEFAAQIKSRYAPESAEYVDAKHRYEEAATKFDALVETLALSVKENSGKSRIATLREQARLAVEASDSFADWVDGMLQLLGRQRRGAGASPKAAEAAEAAAALSGVFGQRDERVKGRTVELMNELVKFKPWDEIPPVTTSTNGASSVPSTSPTPAPSTTPPPAGR